MVSQRYNRGQLWPSSRVLLRNPVAAWCGMGEGMSGTRHALGTYRLILLRTSSASSASSAKPWPREKRRLSVWKYGVATQVSEPLAKLKDEWG
jgi:hypothetical protein